MRRAPSGVARSVRLEVARGGDVVYGEDYGAASSAVLGRAEEASEVREFMKDTRPRNKHDTGWAEGAPLLLHPCTALLNLARCGGVEPMSRLAPSSYLNDGNVYAETVPAAASGQLLLDFLSCRYTHSSRDAWSAHGEAGRICLDAVPVSPDTVLRAGQLLEYHRPPWREPPAPRWLWALLNDEHVLVLLKPSGLPVLP